jgi:23S rRNA (cytosine1962-C5)-methyltransferase
MGRSHAQDRRGRCPRGCSTTQLRSYGAIRRITTIVGDGLIITVMPEASDVGLVDVGDAARLERFGDRLVDRPHPAAFSARRDPAAWLSADLRFDRDAGWSGPAVDAGAWNVEVAGIPLELRTTDGGQVGLFPEHAAMLPWLGDRVADRLDVGERPAILHLFAYTGLTTLALAQAGAAVTHVDASRPTVAWARRNAEIAGLADRPIRWIVDDARTFTEREARRDRRYAGIVLDPPSYGHGPDGRAWRLETDLEPLLAESARILEPGGFVLLTAHTPAVDGDELRAAVDRAMRLPAPTVEVGELGLDTADGRRLGLGWFARVARRA